MTPWLKTTGLYCAVFVGDIISHLAPPNKQHIMQINTYIFLSSNIIVYVICDNLKKKHIMTMLKDKIWYHSDYRI